jgi:TolA-binding protein
MRSVRAAQVILSSFLLFVGVAGTAWAQDAAPAEEPIPDQTVGTLVYYEGAVAVAQAEEAWSEAKIEQALRPTHTLRTGPNASAEIQWGNGTSTVVGPGTTQSIASLYEEAKKEKQANASQDGLIQGFVRLFAESSPSGDGSGGIRRGRPTVTFAEAAGVYRDKHYRKAVRKLSLYLDQNPLSPKAKMARFALGHCYLELNNPLQAKAAFEAVSQNYPEHALADRARKVLDTL